MKNQKKQNFGFFNLQKDLFGHKQIWYGFASLEKKYVSLDQKDSCIIQQNSGKELLTLTVKQNTYKSTNQYMHNDKFEDKLDIEEQSNMNEEQFKSEAEFLENPLLNEVEYLKVEECQIDALNYFVTFLPFNIAKFELKKLKILEIISSDIVGAQLAQIIFNNKDTIEHIRLMNLRSLHFLEADQYYILKANFFNRWVQYFKEYVILNETSQILKALCFWINFEHQDEFLYNLKEFYIDFNCDSSPKFNCNSSPDSSPKFICAKNPTTKKDSKITQISPMQNQITAPKPKMQLGSADIKHLQTLYKNFVSQKLVEYQYKNQQISKLKRRLNQTRPDHFNTNSNNTNNSKDLIYSSFRQQQELNDDLIKSKILTYHPFTSMFWRYQDLRIIWSQTEDFGYILKHLLYRHIIFVATSFIGIISWPIYFLCIASKEDLELYDGEDLKKKKRIQAKLSFVRSLLYLLQAILGYIPNICKLTDSEYQGFLLAIYFLVNVDIHVFLQDQANFGEVILNLSCDLPKEEKLIYEFSKYQVDFSCFYLRFMDDIRDTYFLNVLPIMTSEVSKELSIAMNAKLLKIKNAQWRSGLMVCNRYLYIDKLVVSPLIKTDSKGIPKEDEPIFKFYEQAFAKIKNSKFKKLGVLFYCLVVAAQLVLPTYYYCGYLRICTSFKFIYFSVAYSIWCLYIYFLVFQQIIILMGLIMNRRLHSLSRLSELINISNKKPLFFTPKELPSLNIFCVVSVESWNNMRKFTITDCKSARNNADIVILVIGTQASIQIVLLALDYLCLLDSSFQHSYIWSDFVLAAIITFESLFYLGMVLMSLKKKADFNLYFQEFKLRFQAIKSVLKKFEFFSSLYYQTDQKGGSQSQNKEQFNKPKSAEVSVSSMQYDDDQIIDRFLQEQTFTGIEDTDYEDQGGFGSESNTFGQIFTAKSFKILVQEAKNYELIKVKSNSSSIQSEHEIVLQYIQQLSKQYKEIQNELLLDQELRSEIFLGIIPITYPIIKSLLIAILTFIGGFVVKYILSLQQQKQK